MTAESIPDHPPGLDRHAVASWLGLRSPVAFSRIGQGQSNLTYQAVDADGRRVVLRRPPVGRLLASAHDVEREHRILRALEATPVPTPPLIAFTADPAVSDAPLLAMGFVDGLVVDDADIAERLAPEARHRLGCGLATALATLHAVDLASTGLADLASHRSYAARQLRRWRAQWEASEPGDEPRVIELADRLAAAMPAQHELTLVHGDFHLRNVIAAPDGRAIRAILDWELCTLGDPLADLGTLLAYWREPGDVGGSLFPAAAPHGFPSRAELAATYAEATGRNLDALPFWHALALWKLAVIGQGVSRRAQDDPRNAAGSGLPAAELVGDLLERASQVAAEADI
jgi:aminoglycoside phosphotransferase (APT) family kinase protein